MIEKTDDQKLNLQATKFEPEKGFFLNLLLEIVVKHIMADIHIVDENDKDQLMKEIENLFKMKKEIPAAQVEILETLKKSLESESIEFKKKNNKNMASNYVVYLVRANKSLLENIGVAEFYNSCFGVFENILKNLKADPIGKLAILLRCFPYNNETTDLETKMHSYFLKIDKAVKSEKISEIKSSIEEAETEFKKYIQVPTIAQPVIAPITASTLAEKSNPDAALEDKKAQTLSESTSLKSSSLQTATDLASIATDRTVSQSAQNLTKNSQLTKPEAEKGFFVNILIKIVVKSAMLNAPGLDDEDKDKLSQDIDNLFKLDKKISNKQTEILETLKKLIRSGELSDKMGLDEHIKFLVNANKDLIKNTKTADFLSDYLEVVENTLEEKIPENLVQLLLLVKTLPDFKEIGKPEQEREIYSNIKGLFNKIELLINTGNIEVSQIKKLVTEAKAGIKNNFEKQKSARRKSPIDENQIEGSILGDNKNAQNVSEAMPNLKLKQATTELNSFQTEKTLERASINPVSLASKSTKKSTLERLADWMRKYFPSFADSLDKFLGKDSNKDMKNSSVVLEKSQEKPNKGKTERLTIPGKSTSIPSKQGNEKKKGK